MDVEFTASTDVEVVERYPGARSTDVSGISIAFSGLGSAAISSDQLGRELRLMRANWALTFVRSHAGMGRTRQQGLNRGESGLQTLVRDRDHAPGTQRRLVLDRHPAADDDQRGCLRR